jgi:drug/metabolite transporter (DMT)-like permease
MANLITSLITLPENNGKGQQSFRGQLMAIALGIAALACWIFFWIFVLFDVYLTHPELDMLVRFILVAAILLNIAGIILEIIKLIKKRKWLSAVAGLALHILPLAAAGSFAYWLAYGHWL